MVALTVVKAVAPADAVNAAAQLSLAGGVGGGGGPPAGIVAAPAALAGEPDLKSPMVALPLPGAWSQSKRKL